MVIPPRWHKLGKRFGFVCFREASELTHLAVKLDNIFIDNMKLFVNQPRFERLDGGNLVVKQTVDLKGGTGTGPNQVWRVKNVSNI